MRVSDLKKRLEDMPNDALIVINNEVVNDICLENGRESQQIMNRSWKKLDQGKRVAIRFTKYEELSDGKMYDINY